MNQVYVRTDFPLVLHLRTTHSPPPFIPPPYSSYLSRFARGATLSVWRVLLSVRFCTPALGLHCLTRFFCIPRLPSYLRLFPTLYYHSSPGNLCHPHVNYIGRDRTTTVTVLVCGARARARHAPRARRARARDSLIYGSFLPTLPRLPRLRCGTTTAGIRALFRLAACFWCAFCCSCARIVPLYLQYTSGGCFLLLPHVAVTCFCSGSRMEHFSRVVADAPWRFAVPCGCRTVPLCRVLR